MHKFQEHQFYKSVLQKKTCANDKEKISKNEQKEIDNRQAKNKETSKIKHFLVTYEVPQSLRFVIKYHMIDVKTYSS